MDPVLLLVLGIGISFAMLFNYYLNRAPGSDPEDFQLGPQELGITCDCYLNVVVISGITVLAIALSSNMFDSSLEMAITGVIAFILVTAAGFIGRRRRYHEWNDLHHLFDRVMPESRIRGLPSDSIGYTFDDDE